MNGNDDYKIICILGVIMMTFAVAIVLITAIHSNSINSDDYKIGMYAISLFLFLGGCIPYVASKYKDEL